MNLKARETYLDISCIELTLFFVTEGESVNRNSKTSGMGHDVGLGDINPRPTKPPAETISNVCWGPPRDLRLHYFWEASRLDCLSEATGCYARSRGLRLHSKHRINTKEKRIDRT